jgi:two-component system, chemotaxis family, CheB/CheR fusion protein
MVAVSVTAAGAGAPADRSVPMQGKTPIEERGKSGTKVTDDDLLIVGIGASAGGLAPLQTLLKAMQPGCGLAFVVIQHLDPTQPSYLTEILSGCTSLSVSEPADRARVEADHVYTISPNKELTIRDGTLRVTALDPHDGRRLPIDDFLHALAEDRREKAACIILSGAGTDGTQGLRSIHAFGGIVIVQEPETAEFAGMPRSAIATGQADWVLPVEKMPGVLLGYARHDYVRGGEAILPREDDAAVTEQVVDVLRTHGRTNVEAYKKSAVARRIRRRMSLRQIGSVTDYRKLLSEDASEVEALNKDLLITVSEFFRDAEAWQTLEKEVVRPLVMGAGAQKPIRVWVPAAATGEEPYSVTMLLLEQRDALEKPFPMQIFATDVSESALEVARAGIYPAGIAASVSPERLQRFFSEFEERHGYQVRRRVRDLVTFAAHDLLRSPPFSKLDLICCRNLFIYLEPEAQETLLAVFQLALVPGGVLFLGPSESVGEQVDLFATISKKWRIYRRIGPARLNRALLPPPSEGAGRGGALRLAAQHPAAVESPVAALAQRLIVDHLAPASVVINRRNEIIFFSGPTDRYLVQPGGTPTRDVVAMAGQGLRAKLRVALRKASRHNRSIVVDNVPVDQDGIQSITRVRVIPVKEPGEAEGLMLLAFEESRGPGPARRRRSIPPEDRTLRDFEEELTSTQEELRRAVEQLEISNRESSAANEEILAVNKELQARNEELQRSKEEIQSVNEELLTVNSQLERKVQELQQANSDLENLMASTSIATICLDRELRIKWFTSVTTDLLQLIPADVGRPIADLASKFIEDDLIPDARSVLDREAPLEREVQTAEGRWYMRRVLPYRTPEERIDGVVVTLTNIDLLKRADLELKELNAKLEQRVAERTRHMKLLQDLVVIANEANSVEPAVRHSLGRVCREFGWPIGHAWLPRARDQTVFCDSGIWWPESAGSFAPLVEASRAIEFRSGEGLVGRAIAAGGPRWIGNVAEDPAFVRLVSLLTGQGIRGAVAAPVLTGREIVGVLEFFTREITEPPALLLEGLSGLGAQLGRVIERKRAEEALRRISAELQLAEERERRQLAADLHDDLGQILPLAKMRIDALRASVPPDLAKPLSEVSETIERASEAARSVTFQLSPPILREIGLVAAIEWLTEHMRELHGLTVKVESDSEPVGLSEATRGALFRCVRELLLNVVKHAQATEAEIRIATRGSKLSIVVKDDGVGFTPDPATGTPQKGGFGLFSIRERLTHLGGSVDIASIPANGSEVTITAPLGEDDPT